MTNRARLAVALFSGIAIGSLGTLSIAQAPEPKPAYLIVASDAKPGADQAALARYREAAAPLAREAGLQVLARGEALPLEGNWPFGAITVERFTSMQALRDFWFSEAYQTAKKLREGQSTVHFIVGVEGS